jgi:hypothetical protein
MIVMGVILEQRSPRTMMRLMPRALVAGIVAPVTTARRRCATDDPPRRRRTVVRVRGVEALTSPTAPRGATATLARSDEAARVAMVEHMDEYDEQQQLAEPHHYRQQQQQWNCEPAAPPLSAVAAASSASIRRMPAADRAALWAGVALAREEPPASTARQARDWAAAAADVEDGADVTEAVLADDVAKREAVNAERRAEMVQQRRLVARTRRAFDTAGGNRGNRGGTWRGYDDPRRPSRVEKQQRMEREALTPVLPLPSPLRPKLDHGNDKTLPSQMRTYARQFRAGVDGMHAAGAGASEPAAAECDGQQQQHQLRGWWHSGMDAADAAHEAVADSGGRGAEASSGRRRSRLSGERPAATSTTGGNRSDAENATPYRPATPTPTHWNEPDGDTTPAAKHRRQRAVPSTRTNKRPGDKPLGDLPRIRRADDEEWGVAAQTKHQRTTAVGDHALGSDAEYLRDVSALMGTKAANARAHEERRDRQQRVHTATPGGDDGSDGGDGGEWGVRH